MKSVYKEVEEIVKERGEKIATILTPISPKTVWAIKGDNRTFLAVIDEKPNCEENRIVSVIEKTEGLIPCILYLSPASKRGGVKENLFLLMYAQKDITEETFSENRLAEFLATLKK